MSLQHAIGWRCIEQRSAIIIVGLDGGDNRINEKLGVIDDKEISIEGHSVWHELSSSELIHHRFIFIVSAPDHKTRIVPKPPNLMLDFSLDI